MKKILIVFVAFLCLHGLCGFSFTVFAEDTDVTEEEIEEELTDTVTDLLDDLDLSEFESLYVDEYQIFGNTTFKEKVKDLLNGEYFTNYDNVFKAVVSLLFDGIASLLPLILTILAIAILSSMIQNFKSSSYNVGNIINFVCFAVIITILAVNFKNIIETTSSTLSLMKNQMDVIFPIILTLITAIGGTVSVGIFKPVVAILSGGISTLFSYVLMPMFVLSFIFTVIGSLSPNVKFNKMVDFLSSSFKWIVGFVFTLFSAFLTIQGISAGKYDGVSINASKFAIKSYIPIIGGYLSEGLDFIMLGSLLIKNAIGVAGLIIIFLTIFAPIIQFIIFKLGLQLIAGLIEPMGNKELGSLISNCSKIMIYPIVILLGVSFMYILTIGILMCTANFI